MKNAQEGCKRNAFPGGVFVTLLLLLFLLSAATAAGYFYWNAGNRSGEIERDTKKYATAMTEALGHVAELSYASKNYSRLKTLLREKIGENSALEAFFILIDGRIVAHSSHEAEERLLGNVANDEFAYNLDLLLLPVRNGGSEVLFIDYNIINQKPPFDKYRRELLRRFIYPRIGAVGWLASRAVYHRGRAVGTVNLILSKRRIHSSLESLGRESVALCVALSACSLLISMAVSLMVYRRDRRDLVVRPEGRSGVQKQMRTINIEDAEAVITPPGVLEGASQSARRGVKDAIPLFK